MQVELFRLYDPAEARRTILRRLPVGETVLTPTLARGLERVFGETLPLEEAIRRILSDVRERGEAAVFDWTEKIDGVRLETLAVAPEEIEAAYESIPAELREALHLAAERIRAFHQKQPTQSWLEWRD